jgi:hypothetical protein
MSIVTSRSGKIFTTQRLCLPWCTYFGGNGQVDLKEIFH